MADITQVLAEIERGDGTAADKLLPLVYDELRKLAAAKLAQEKPGQTLQATALVHEAYLRLNGAQHAANWDSRGHFFAAAAEAMRRILVDMARRKQSLKRAGGRGRVDLELAAALPVTESDSENLLAVHEALTLLQDTHPRKAELVKLRFFAGLTLDEAAAALDVSVATAKKDWIYARAWLFDRLSTR